MSRAGRVNTHVPSQGTVHSSSDSPAAGASASALRTVASWSASSPCSALSASPAVASTRWGERAATGTLLRRIPVAVRSEGLNLRRW